MIRFLSMLLPAILLLTGFLVTPAFGLIYVSNIRHWAAPDYTRVVIDTSDEATYTVAKEGRRITLTVKDADLAEDVPLQSFLNKPGVEKIEVVTLPDESVRIELTLTQDVEAKVFKLKKFLEKPNRIVIDLQFPEVEEKESLSRQEVKKLQKARIIVIDAGHGGEDPGAIGKMGTREKDVVLKIAKKLHDNLNKREGYRAFLTRAGDYYVPFNKRTKIARDYGADAFVSIHADAVRNRASRGGSVYILSTRGATNETARLLARKENLADVMGGWANDDNHIDESDIITLDMVMTNTVNRSRELAQLSLRNISDINYLKFTQVQGAPFRVLKHAEIPSVLIETAYISNPTEEKLLRTPAFQDEMAGAIAKAIVKFVPSGQPTVPVRVAVASDKTAPAASKKEDRTEKPRQREGRAIEKAREDDEAPSSEEGLGEGRTGRGAQVRPGTGEEERDRHLPRQEGRHAGQDRRSQRHDRVGAAPTQQHEAQGSPLGRPKAEGSVTGRQRGGEGRPGDHHLSGEKGGYAGEDRPEAPHDGPVHPNAQPPEVR